MFYSLLGTMSPLLVHIKIYWQQSREWTIKEWTKWSEEIVLFIVIWRNTEPDLYMYDGPVSIPGDQTLSMTWRGKDMANKKFHQYKLITLMQNACEISLLNLLEGGTFPSLKAPHISVQLLYRACHRFIQQLSSQLYLLLTIHWYLLCSAVKYLF